MADMLTEKRLTYLETYYGPDSVNRDDEVLCLVADLRELREAAGPFAAIAWDWVEESDKDGRLSDEDCSITADLSGADLRRLAACLPRREA